MANSLTIAELNMLRGITRNWYRSCMTK